MHQPPVPPTQLRQPQQPQQMYIPYPSPSAIHQQQHQPSHGPSNSVQGLYSSYPARLRNSLDNALLLPSSYLNNKKLRFNDDDADSEDEFDDYMDDSDTTSSRMTGRTRSTRARSLHDSTTVDNATSTLNNQDNNINNTKQSNKDQISSGGEKSLPIGVAKENLNLPKNIRMKNHIYPKQEEIENAATITEVLVPIRLDIDVDDVKLRDVFLWNMHEQFLTPEKFGEMLCQDIDLDPSRFVPLIAESIRQQVIDFESVHEIEIPMENQTSVVINLDLQVGKVNLRDKFEWNLSNVSTNAPELFSKQMAAELGLGGEYVTIISHSIREQLYKHKRQLVDDYGTDQGSVEPLTSAFRRIENSKSWSPQLELLSNEELEKILIAQERNIRRLRRENRFKRSRRRGSLLSRRTGSNAGTPS
ncbi:unnamed protein product [Cunninghamella echinulata]